MLNKVPLSDITAPLRAQTAELLDLTIELAKINTGSFNHAGVEKAAQAVMPRFIDLGCQYRVCPVSAFKQVNNQGVIVEHPLGPVLRFWQRPHAKQQVLLVGHIDTVFGVDHPFQTIKKISADKINGPGVADMKGGIVVMLAALRMFEELAATHSFVADLGWEVILTPDEEIGSPGSAELLAERAAEHNFGLVFEPSVSESGIFAGDRKGSGKFTFVVSGRAAHAGRNFAEGRNAICKMAALVCELDKLNNQRPDLTLNIGCISGGDAVNVVPDKCICRVDLRYNDLADEAWVEECFASLIAKLNAADNDYNIELFGAFGRKPKRITGATAKLYNLLSTVGAELSLPVQWQATGGCCDGNNLSAAGLPNIDTLGVRGGSIHSAAEYLMVDSLAERAQLTLGLLIKLACLQ